MSVLDGVRGFLDRFVHPRIAALALLGVALVAAASVVALVAVGLGNLGYYGVEYTYVPLASLVSLLGILLWAFCAAYLGTLRALQIVLGR